MSKALAIRSVRSASPPVWWWLGLAAMALLFALLRVLLEMDSARVRRSRRFRRRGRAHRRGRAGLDRAGGAAAQLPAAGGGGRGGMVAVGVFYDGHRSDGGGGIFGGLVLRAPADGGLGGGGADSPGGRKRCLTCRDFGAGG